MSKIQRVINTPELLDSLYSSYVSPNSSGGGSTSPPNSSLNQMQIDALNNATQGNALNNNLSEIPYDPVIASIADDGEFWTKAKTVKEAWKVSKPSGYRLGKFQVGGEPGYRMRNIKFIVLHHTATNVSVERTQVKSFFPSDYGKSSQAIIGKDGHTEYVVPLPFKANAQGKNQWVNGKTKTVRPNFNSISTSVEVINYGFLDKKFKKDGKTYWYRKSKETSFEQETETSAPYDFQGNKIKSYKGHKRCEEYTDASLKAMVTWIKKQQLYIANNYPKNKEILTWKYTEETHNQMFPNYYSKKRPSNWKSQGGEYIEKEYLITGLSSGKPGEVKYNSNKRAWAVSKDIYGGKIGIYTHNSISTGKSDVFPTKKMVECLKINFG